MDCRGFARRAISKPSSVGRVFLMAGLVVATGCQGGDKPPSSATQGEGAAAPGGGSVPTEVSVKLAPPALAPPTLAPAGTLTCAPTTPTASDAFADIWIGPYGEVWAVGSNGLIGQRTPGDAGTWSYCRLAGMDIFAVSGTASDDVWMLGRPSTIIHWTDGQFVAVTETGAPISGGLRDVFGRLLPSGPSVWVVGQGGVVRHFDGVAWQVADTGAEYDMRSVWVSPMGVVRATGNGTLPPPPPLGDPYNISVTIVFLLTDAGWTHEAEFSIVYGAASLNKIRGAADDDIWAVGVRYPAGAADSFSLAVAFDGTSWSVACDDVDAGTYLNVAVRPPFAPYGAVITGTAPPRVFDGTTWSRPTPLLGSIDVRDDAAWATTGGRGENATAAILRWDGSAWQIDNGVAAGDRDGDGIRDDLDFDAYTSNPDQTPPADERMCELGGGTP